MHTYEITVDGYGAAHYAGATPGSARAQAWRSFQNARECTFKEFLKLSRIRKSELPAASGYEYVKRAYGVDAQAGKRVSLCNEGKSDGREGTIVYPGKHTAHVHVLMDDEKQILHVHPDSIQILA